ncbi:GATA transcription factor 9 [Gastrolobium bilobum]|uniref:GATA transcription factor 9 n=1 Tax=Gastrolobium bilobum TaxID=150636 RepID=UPI002AB0410F|nr:GATA transcription factor 9 [Gastrolobium bilobum]
MEAQEYFQTSFCPQFPSDNMTTTNNVNASSDHFIVEDFFDFSNDNDEAAITDPTFDSLPANSTDDSPTVTPVDSTSNSSSCHPNFVADIADGHFSSDLSVPYDDLAELEWLSKFGEESFSSEDLQKLQLISGMKAPNDAASETREPNPVFNPQVSVPAKARSKRSRGPPCNWTSRLLVLSPSTTTSSSPSDPVATPKKPAPRRRDTADGGDGRKCLHCATDKTPQWRTGPMGPKTLCNACGVRYKSGRLVPEYRPAASPTFVLTKHSNSHRKVMELRRQKETVRAQQQQLLQLQHHQNMMFDVPSNGDDYLIHQHVGPDFSHLI